MMKRARIGVIAAAVLAVATIAFAQKTDFSGSWAPEADPAAAAPPAGGGGGRGGGMAGPMTVKQTATELSIESAGRGGGMQTRVYKLDGSESKITMGQGEATAVAKWDGPKLIITTKRTGQDGTPIETVATWSLAGGVLTVESTGGRGPSKTVYKKTT